MIKRLGFVIYWFTFLLGLGVGVLSIQVPGVLVEVSEEGAAAYELFTYRSRLYGLDDERTEEALRAIPSYALSVIVAQNDGEPLTTPDYRGMAIYWGIAFLIFLVGYSIRFILTGNKSIFPWKS